MVFIATFCNISAISQPKNMKMECQILIDNNNLLWFNSYSSYIPEVIIQQKVDFLLSEQTLGTMEFPKMNG
jgi:hypothetical protein